MAKLYLPNIIAEAAVTEIALLHGFSRGGEGWALATDRIGRTPCFSGGATMTVRHHKYLISHGGSI